MRLFGSFSFIMLLHSFSFIMLLLNSFSLCFRTMRIYMIVATTLLLMGCNTDYDSGKTNNNATVPSLSVSSNDVILQGSSMQILVSLASLSQDDFTIQSSMDSSQSLNNVTFNFIDTDDYSKFNIGYSTACSNLTDAETCVITLTPNTSALALSGNQISYYISALSGSTPLISDPSYFAMKTLNVNTSVDDLGAGTSEILTVSNDSGMDIDLTGAQFLSDSPNVSFSDNNCNGMLADQHSCIVTVTANDSSISQEARISMINASGVFIFSDSISIIRPSIDISPSSEINLEPNESQLVTISNNSTVDIKELMLNLPNINDVTINANSCGSLLSAESNCSIMLNAGTTPKGEGVITASAENADSQHKIISAITRPFLSIALSQDYIASNSLANKQVTVTVQNTSESTSLGNLTLNFSPALSSFQIVPFLSSCNYLTGGILLPQQHCQYTIAFNPATTTIALSQDVKIQAIANGGASAQKTLSSTVYPTFYSLPVNASNTKTSIAASNPYAVAVSGDNIYLGTSSGLSISNDGGVRWKNLTAANGLAASNISSILLYNDRIYVGTNQGLSISDNNGNTWTNTTIKDGLNSDNITSISLSNNTIYLGTGSDTYGNTGGVSFSSDGGETWQHYTLPDSTTVKDVAVENGVIYVGTTMGLFYSTDGTNWQQYTTANGLASNTVNSVVVKGNTIYAGTQDGLSISTDGGNNWTSYTTANGIKNNTINDVLIYSGRIYVATNSSVSISSDNGATWVTSNSHQKHALYVDNGIIYAAGSNHNLEASKDYGSNWIPISQEALTQVKSTYPNNITIYNNMLLRAANNLFMLTNKGTLWTKITGTSSDNAIPVSIMSLFTASNTLYAGSTNGAVSTSTDGASWSIHLNTASSQPSKSIFSTGNAIYLGNISISYSPDGGTSWSQINSENGLKAKNVYSIISSNNILYASSYGNGASSGVSYSTDGGVSWKTYTTANGLASTNVNALFANEGTLYAATEKGLSYSTDGGSHWSTYTTENGLVSNTVTAVVANGNSIFAGTNNGLSVSNDGGKSWKTYTTANGLDDNKIISIRLSGSTIYVVTPVGVSGLTQVGTTWKKLANQYPINSIFATDSAIYIGGISANLEISTDDGNSWTDKELSGTSGISSIFAVGQNIYIARKADGVSLSKDDGNSWTTSTTQNGLGSNIVHYIFASGDTIYAATEKGLSISSDGGQNWINKTKDDGLISNIINAVFVDNNTIYAATDLGLSISNDGGQSWVNRTKDNGLGANDIHDVFADGHNIYAATQGGLSISADGGQNWINKTTTNGLKQTPVTRVFATGNTLYAVSSAKIGSGLGTKVESSLNISKDGGNTWQSYSKDEGIDGDISSVFALGSTVYIGTDEGLYASLDYLEF